MPVRYFFAVILGLLAAPAFASDRGPQVVGGVPVEAGQFPFIVQIATPIPGGGVSLCTGSLIRDNWVLTAAHCASNGTTPNAVLISDAYPMILGPSHTATAVGVAQWIPHPQFNSTTLANDIALIRLSQSASANPPKFNGAPLYTPSPITLATSPSATTASIGNVVIAGYGRIDDGSLPQFVYWAGGIPTFSTSVCNQIYPTLSPSQQLCFGTYPNTCQGDSGGAVFKQNGQQFTQFGIVSFNKGAEFCGDVESVATYVPGYVSWINQQIDGTPPPPPSSPIKYGWELPPPANQGVATGVSNIQGWTYSTAGAITSVRIERNGQHFLTIPCCSERGDVKGSNPSIPVLTGFSAASSWGLLGNGPTQITLVIRDSANNELRETRTIDTVQPFIGVPRVTNLGFLPSSSCNFSTENGVAKAECSNLTFTQGTCNGRMTFAWSNGKGAFELFDGCH